MALETEGRLLDTEACRRGTEQVLAGAVPAYYLVAELDGELAGQLMVTTEWSDWRDGVFWWIQSVYIAPRFRRRGIYRALYGHLLAEARRDPAVCGLRLYVDRGNAAAKEVYRSLGMHPTDYELYEVDFAEGGE